MLTARLHGRLPPGGAFSKRGQNKPLTNFVFVLGALALIYVCCVLVSLVRSHSSHPKPHKDLLGGEFRRVNQVHASDLTLTGVTSSQPTLQHQQGVPARNNTTTSSRTPDIATNTDPDGAQQLPDSLSHPQTLTPRHEPASKSTPPKDSKQPPRRYSSKNYPKPDRGRAASLVYDICPASAFSVPSFGPLLLLQRGTAVSCAAYLYSAAFSRTTPLLPALPFAGDMPEPSVTRRRRSSSGSHPAGASQDPSPRKKGPRANSSLDYLFRDPVESPDKLKREPAPPLWSPGDSHGESDEQSDDQSDSAGDDDDSGDDAQPDPEETPGDEETGGEAEESPDVSLTRPTLPPAGTLRKLRQSNDSRTPDQGPERLRSLIGDSDEAAAVLAAVVTQAAQEQQALSADLPKIAKLRTPPTSAALPEDIGRWTHVQLDRAKKLREAWLDGDTSAFPYPHSIALLNHPTRAAVAQSFASAAICMLSRLGGSAAGTAALQLSVEEAEDAVVSWPQYLSYERADTMPTGRETSLPGTLVRGLFVAGARGSVLIDLYDPRAPLDTIEVQDTLPELYRVEARSGDLVLMPPWVTASILVVPEINSKKAEDEPKVDWIGRAASQARFLGFADSITPSDLPPPPSQTHAAVLHLALPGDPALTAGSILPMHMGSLNTPPTSRRARLLTEDDGDSGEGQEGGGEAQNGKGSDLDNSDESDQKLDDQDSENDELTFETDGDADGNSGAEGRGVDDDGDMGGGDDSGKNDGDEADEFSGDATGTHDVFGVGEDTPTDTTPDDPVPAFDESADDEWNQLRQTDDQGGDEEDSTTDSDADNTPQDPPGDNEQADEDDGQGSAQGDIRRPPKPGGTPDELLREVQQGGGDGVQGRRGVWPQMQSQPTVPTDGDSSPAEEEAEDMCLDVDRMWFAFGSPVTIHNLLAVDPLFDLHSLREKAIAAFTAFKHCLPNNGSSFDSESPGSLGDELFDWQVNWPDEGATPCDGGNPGASGDALNKAWRQAYKAYIESKEHKLMMSAAATTVVSVLKHLGKEELSREDPGVFSWLTVHDESMSFHGRHYHRNQAMTAVLYLELPDESAPLEFSNPIAGPDSEPNGRAVFVPTIGDFVLFPSYLPHTVPMRLLRDRQNPRISIAFNIWFSGPGLNRFAEGLDVDDRDAVGKHQYGAVADVTLDRRFVPREGLTQSLARDKFLPG